MVPQTTTDGETCRIAACDEPTPWDMPAIIIGDEWFCSPDCARDHLSETDDAPGVVVFHDPQFAVSRDEFADAVGERDVDIRRTVGSVDAALEAVDEIESLFPAEFRVAIHE